MDLKLPAAIEPFRTELLDTKEEFIRVRANAAEETAPWRSKVGGLPYLPNGHEWPKNEDGTPLFFLAQINFQEIPPLKPFPTKGIVQFYIGDDDLYGMDFDDGEHQGGFRVLFHPDPVSDLKLLKSTLPTEKVEYDLLPHHPDESFPLAFSKEEEVLPVTDYQFSDRFGAGFFQQFGEKEWEVYEDFGRKVRSDGHKIGGYAYFTQDDPRRKEDPMLLLLQLDSDELMDLMWGDMGVGHFFIRASDLERRDFSKVLYDWDCL